ncbi:LysR family transcriptional regulator (plasmid) [Achromobacter xylosoxidans]|uniref:LysR family transcriptional regulator n=1 Tax=Alcaligenes xylosoxydans xylosoxydans TaxID=85698 RepID=UPI000DD1293B|nr:LysR family transcriptional regulator [Achromobacter xylosoxidans]AXA80545.1 LysR family transcriptional regulator [Achromobacter xylosoxidans]
MTFDLHQLAAFNAIASTGSLGRAADQLSVTQPALSRMVRRLEEQVGAPLFERHSRGMTLTDIGQALLPHARMLEREARAAKEEIHAMLGFAKGTIRVGAVASIACLLLPLAIDRVCRKWPNLRVEVVESVSDRLAGALISREIDLALGVLGADCEEIVGVPDCSWEDVSYVVAGVNHPLREREALTLADTVDYKWAILPKGTGPYTHVTKMFAERNLPAPNVVVETRSITVLKNLVAHSEFLGWMPEPMYEAERCAGLIDRLDIHGTADMRTLTAFRRRQGLLPGPAVKLLDEFRVLTSRSLRR